MKSAPSVTSFAPWILMGLIIVYCSSTSLRAKDLVPGAYTPAPTGFNVVTLTGVFNNGAPAMTRQQFAKYRATTILGVSLNVGAPIGQYVCSRYEVGDRSPRTRREAHRHTGALALQRWANGATRSPAEKVGRERMRQLLNGASRNGDHDR